jgi:hypothetical protein
MANSKIVMLKLTGKLPQILKNASAKNLINQFCLIQCLEFLKAMKVTNSGLREFATIVCSHVTGSKSPASLHMLYAVSSALPSFLFEDLVD